MQTAIKTIEEPDHAQLKGSMTVTGACVTAFSFETNGYQGGDAGHGGYLEISIDGTSSTMMSAVLDGSPMPQIGDGDHKVSLRFFGDSEMENVAKGLEFLAIRIRQALLQPTETPSSAE
jgi:hypothetical protein